MQKENIAAQTHWNLNPCGLGDYLKEYEPNSLTYFDAIRFNRYFVTDPWMLNSIDFTLAKGKKLLEIGHGIGSDLLTFAENGAEVYGIDITQTHHEMAKLNFNLHNKACTLKIGSAEELEYPSDFFDVVYSHGVLHHVSDTFKCIEEAYRVLKPSGRLIITLYYKWSAFHIYYKLLLQGILKGNLFKLGYRGLMATIERGADGTHNGPFVRTFSKKTLRHYLKNFSEVNIKIAHFKGNHLPPFRRLFPSPLETALEKFIGWYVIAHAKK